MHESSRPSVQCTAVAFEPRRPARILRPGEPWALRITVQCLSEMSQRRFKIGWHLPRQGCVLGARGLRAAELADQDAAIFEIPIDPDSNFRGARHFSSYPLLFRVEITEHDGTEPPRVLCVLEIPLSGGTRLFS